MLPHKKFLYSHVERDINQYFCTWRLAPHTLIHIFGQIVLHNFLFCKGFSAVSWTKTEKNNKTQLVSISCYNSSESECQDLHTPWIKIWNQINRAMSQNPLHIEYVNMWQPTRKLYIKKIIPAYESDQELHNTQYRGILTGSHTTHVYYFVSSCTYQQILSFKNQPFEGPPSTCSSSPSVYKNNPARNYSHIIQKHAIMNAKKEKIEWIEIWHLRSILKDINSVSHSNDLDMRKYWQCFYSD